MDKNTRILITGATGFIGRYLAQELVARGYTNLAALARKTANTSFLESMKMEIIRADITDPVSLGAVAGEWDVIFHCAGLVDDRDKDMLHRVNVNGTENICRFAVERRMKKLIYVSSVSVNSGNTETALTEDLPYKPTNIYGESKLEAEKAAIRFRDAGLPMVIVRPCMVYGEGEPHMMALLTKLMRWRLLALPDSGTARWHLVSVRNVASCLLRCMEDDRALGQIFNIADKEILTVREVFEIFSKSLGVPLPVRLPRFLTAILKVIPVVGRRVKFLCKDRVYSIKRLEDVIGFIPPYDAVSELRRVGQKTA